MMQERNQEVDGCSGSLKHHLQVQEGGGSTGR